MSGESSPAPVVPPQPIFGPRLAMGLLGVLLAAMMVGLNGRVPGLVLADLRGALGFSLDDASWLTSLYSAGELAAMPFATWFAITFSLRRFFATMLSVSLALSIVTPFAQDLHLAMALRFLHGFLGGPLIPLLMMSALRFLPLPIRLHGLAIFALVATFSPNVALWLAALCVDRLEDWRWVYWHVVPLGLVAMGLVLYGVPKAPMALARVRQANWPGMALGVPGLALLVIGVDQGVRLDWFNSPLIMASLLVGAVFTALFLSSEWLHPAPFMRLQILGRRNLGLGFLVFFFLLMTMSTGVTLPASILAQIQGFRMEQSAPIGLIVGLPQLALGPCVALLLYQRWVDARYVFSAGLICIAAACWLSSALTGEWMAAQFVWPAILHAAGQAMAVVSMLFLSTSVVQPPEGPYVAGIVNMFRVSGTVVGSSAINHVMTERGRFHTETLLDGVGLMLPRMAPPDQTSADLAALVTQQANILAAADVYRIFGALALLLIPLVLTLRRVSAPTRPLSAAPPLPAHSPDIPLLKGGAS